MYEENKCRLRATPRSKTHNTKYVSIAMKIPYFMIYVFMKTSRFSKKQNLKKRKNHDTLPSSRSWRLAKRLITISGNMA